MAFAFSSMTMFNQHDEMTVVSRPHAADAELNPEQTLRDILGFNFGHSGLMFRLDLYRQTDGYPDDMAIIDDLVMALRLAELGSVGYLNDQLYAFRQHTTNTHLSPDRFVIREQILPLIDEAFAGQLARRIPEPGRTRLRREIERQALVHGATASIFAGNYRGGWAEWLRAAQVRPWLTVAQPRTLSLVARSLLRPRAFNLLGSLRERLVKD
jgi:hypothetical protein